MKINDFVLECSKLGITFNEKQLWQFERYYELLIEWNKKINLTAITLKDDVYLKHFYDSLTMVRILDLSKEETLCDVGTGAGFPGIVLKIAFPHIKLTLVDALNKRIKFLSEVVNELSLDNVTLVHMRAEEFACKNREVFDIVTARAVAALPVLLELCIPMVQKGKYFIAYKGDENLNLSSSALKILNCEILLCEKFNLPFSLDTRTLIKVCKKAKTLTKYPRRFDKIKKSHL